MIKRKLRIWFGFACIVLFLLIGVFLWEFDLNIQSAERKRNRDAMESLARQAGLVAESRLNSRINILETAAIKLETDGQVPIEDRIQYLQRVAENSGMDRIDIADVNGDVLTTTGVKVNVADRTYFQTSMQGEVYISTVFESGIPESKGESIVISVPVGDDEGKAAGVLYGVILVDNFNIYASSGIDGETGRLVDIIDNKGNFLVKSGGEHKHGSEDNFFDIIEEQGLDTEEIVKLIGEKQSVYRKVEKDGEKILYYFLPMNVRNWCVVTSLTGNALSANVDYSREIVLQMILKILLAVAVLVAIGYSVVMKESRQNENVLRSQIGKDPLTQTYNRAAATEKINEIFNSDKKSSHVFMLIDLDNFKRLNDSLGHLKGDKALVEVADIIRKHVRPDDVVCRLGGDEFVVFLVDIPHTVIRKNVEALIRKLNLTYEENGKEVSFSASAGIVEAPEYGRDFQTLYEKADQALYQAKQEGKNRFSIYKTQIKK